MGSGKGGGGGATSFDYFGSIFIGLGEGPIDGIKSILEDGKEIWRGPLYRNGATEPGLITIPERGRLWVLWGTAEQASSPVLAKFGDNDRYVNRAGLLGDDFLFGRERSNSPNWEIVTFRRPAQTVVTGAAAELDGELQANVVAFAAEVMTSPTGLALPAARLHQPSWQATADALSTDEMRSLFACSPLLTEQIKARDIFAKLGEVAQLWARRRDDGTIELGRWSPPADLSVLPLITENDLVEDLELDTADMDGLPVEYTIAFTDGARLFKQSSERVADLAAQRVATTPPSPENIDHPEITRRDQARRIITEYMRQRRGGALKGTAQVRRSKALGIRPGDYFRLDVDAIPGGNGLAQLVRCIGRSFGPTGPVALEFQSEPLSAPVPFVQKSEDNTPELQVALRPLHYQRAISLPPEASEPVTVSILAARPDDDIVGMEVLYDDDLEAGTFPTLASIQGFALPVQLASAVSPEAETVRVKTFADLGGGARADRERWMLEDAAGVGETEARDDTLLLVLLRKNPVTGQILATDAGHQVEVLSLRTISLVDADTWDLSVLRGRLGTVALAFDGTGEAVFPDVWSHFEGWVIPRAKLAQLRHSDFYTLSGTGAAGYFRFRPYSRAVTYDPLTSFEAGLQATEGWTTWPFVFPAFELAPTITLDALPSGLKVGPSYILTGKLSDANGDLARYQLHAAKLVTAGGEVDSEVALQSGDVPPEQRQEYPFRASVVFPSSGTWRIVARAFDARGAFTEKKGPEFSVSPADQTVEGLDELISQVDTYFDQQVADLQSDAAALLAQVASLDQAIVDEVSTRSTSDSTLTTSLNALTAEYEGNKAVVASQITSLSDSTGSLASTLSVHAASIAQNAAQIASETEARVTADAGYSTQISSLNTTVNGLNASVATLASAYIVNGQAIATWGFKLDANGKVVGVQAIAANGGTQSEAGVIVFSGADLQTDNFFPDVDGWQFKGNGDVEIGRLKARGVVEMAYGSKVKKSDANNGATLMFEGAGSQGWRQDIYDPNGNFRLINDCAGVQTFEVIGSTYGCNMRIAGGVGGGGDLDIDGYGYGDFTTYSSRLLKDNIRQLEPVLDTLLSLRGVRFDWNGFAPMRKVGMADIGLVAEEVEEVFPEFVTMSPTGLRAVNYPKFVAVLIEALRELRTEIRTKRDNP